ncbi:MAG TPA: addiction module protein [Humisphaera sp.]
MSMSFEQLVAEARSLPASDRERLVEELLVADGEDDAAAIERAWVDEVHRRIAAFDRGETTSMPADRHLAMLREKYAR